METTYRQRIAEIHRRLGIDEQYALKTGLCLQQEADALTSIGLDVFERERFLIENAAVAWQKMRQAALEDKIELQLVSAFRSVDYQTDLLLKKLEQGLLIEDILGVSAAPGYSEHHTGRALDLTTPGYQLLEECFEQSAAFDWLQANAAAYGFYLSYPRGNVNGIAYEPWHWCWHAQRDTP